MQAVKRGCVTRSAGQRRGLWIGPSPKPGGDRSTTEGRQEAADAALRVVDGRVVERYLWTSGCRLAYLGQGVIGTNASPHDPARPRSIFITSQGGWTACPAPGATSRGDGNDLVHALRRRAGCRRRRGDWGAEWRESSREKEWSSSRASASRRPVISNADPRTTLASSALGRSVVGTAGPVGPDGKRDREGEHDAGRATQLQRPARAGRAAPHRAGEYSAQQGGVARASPCGQRRRACRRAPGTSCICRRCSIGASRPRACTR